MTLHLAPNAPWLLLAAALVAAVALSVWAYRIAIPPLPARARRLLPALRAVALALLLLLLAQPVLERAIAGRPRLLVLVDRSLSMDLPVGARGERRAAVADRVVKAVDHAWGGRDEFVARLRDEGVRRYHDQHPFHQAMHAGRLTRADLQRWTLNRYRYVVVSDGDEPRRRPAAAARALGVPVHALLTMAPRRGRSRIAHRRAGDRVVTVRVHADERARHPLGVAPTATRAVARDSCRPVPGPR